MKVNFQNLSLNDLEKEMMSQKGIPEARDSDTSSTRSRNKGVFMEKEGWSSPKGPSSEAQLQRMRQEA